MSKNTVLMHHVKKNERKSENVLQFHKPIKKEK